MKILIVDDHTLIRSGLAQACADLGGDIIEADSGTAALSLQLSQEPEFIILDLNLPGTSGLELLGKLLEADPCVRILVFSMLGEPSYAMRALRLGAKGYITKNAAPEELRMAILRTSKGQTYVEAEIAQRLAARSGEHSELTDRDVDILRLLGDGKSFNEIASLLNVGYKTVANSTSMLKAKLGVSRTADLIRLSIEMRFSKGP
jgi:two-component system, NarL family, invasion response regulator UvrY